MFGVTPQGFPVQTNATVLAHTCCTNALNAGFFNLGELQGQFYVGGNQKVPQYLTNVPSYIDPDDERYKFRNCPTLRAIVEGARHLSVGNEAYGCQDGGNISRALEFHGYITKFDQPTRQCVDKHGKPETITSPPMVAILKSATPRHYVSQNLDPDWAGSITVIGSHVFTHQDFSPTDSNSWVIGTTVFRIEMPHVNFDADGVVGYYSCGTPIRAKDIERYGLSRDQFTQVTRAGYNQIIVQCIHLSS